MGKRTDYFFRVGARMKPHQFGQLFCTCDRAREAPFAFFVYRRASAHSSNLWNAIQIFSVHIFSSKHQFVRLQEKNVQDFSVRTLAPEHRCYLFARLQGFHVIQLFVARSPSSNSVAKFFAFRKPYDPDFLFALLRASINPLASREPSLPNFFSGRGRTRMTQRSFLG